MKKKEDDNRMKLKQVIKQFGGNKAFLMPISLLVSGIGAVARVLPYYFIWKLISELILHFGDVDQKKIFNLAIIIVASQIVSILLNISAGLISHAIAFRVESNIRRQSVQHILRLPLGYFDRNETGRIRKIIDDNASHPLSSGFGLTDRSDASGSLLFLIIKRRFISSGLISL